MVLELRRGSRVAVLGSSGFIGSHVIPALIEAGFDVVGYDLFAPEHLLPAEVRDVRGDVRDTEALTVALQGCAAVLNLAAAHHDFGLTPATFDSVNVGGARSVVAAAEAAGVDNICFYSSVAVYGDAPGRPDEATAPQPVNDYGRTKLEAEGIYRGWQDAGTEGRPRRLLVIRPAVVFGPRNYANVHRMIRAIDRRRFLPVGAGANRKSMVYVENVVAAILHLWTRPVRTDVVGADGPHAPGGFEVYNCVDAPDLTSREIVTEVYRALGRRPSPLRLPLAPALLAARPFDLAARLTGRNLPVTSARIRKLAEAETSFDGSRMRRAGYVQPVTLREGLRRMVGWYRSEARATDPVEHLPPERVGA